MTPTLPLEVGSARKASTDGLGVADELVVGDATRLTGGGRGIVGIDMEALPGVEVGADGVVARGGEAAGDLLGPESQPGRWWMTKTPGKGPSPAGSAW